MDGDPSVHVDFEVDGSVRELVGLPVDWQPAAGDEEAAADADSVTVGQLAEFVVPARGLPDTLKALAHADAGDPESCDCG